MINKLLPFLILFVPQKHFEIYYAVILCFFLIDFIKYPRVNIKYLLIFLILSIIVLFRTTLYFGYDDFKELVKVSFFLIVLNYNYFRQNKYSFNSFKNALICFIILNLIVVFNQLFSFNDSLNTFVSSIYLAESQQILLTYDNVRAPGLSPGVSQQGVVFLMLSMFFWFISFKENSKLNYLMLISSILILVLSQSKSAFFTFLIFISIELLYSNKKYKYLVIPIFSYLVFKSYKSFIVFFKEYNDLITNLWSSSLDGRIENWMNFIAPMLANPFYFLIGIGRNYFSLAELKSSVFDSDYIYIFANFGVIGIIIFLLFMSYLFKKFKNYKSFLYIGLITGFSINFFFEPKSFILLILISSYLNKKINEKKHILDIN
jgi:hypothetical protein